MTPAEAVEAIASGAVLLDVRTPPEWDICTVDGCLKIPMQTIQSRVDELPTDRPIAVLCHHGSRSAQVTAFLQSQGLDAHNVEGGIHRWANEIDDSVARY